MSGDVSRAIGAGVGRVSGARTAIALGGALLAGCGEKEENLEPAPTTPSADAADVAADIAGRWTGELTQKGLPPFQVGVWIDPSGNAMVAYTGINCGGSWRLTLSPPVHGGAEFQFDEEIDRGADGTCKGSGKVTLLQGGTDALKYRFEGGGVTSQGVLHRSDFAALRRVFEQAGLTLQRATVADKVPPE